MSDPKNHHYVPECYLKEFAPTHSKLLQVYDLEFKKAAPSKTPAKVCYSYEYFKIKHEDVRVPGIRQF